MAMVNSKSIRRALEAFQKQNGREPTLKEFNDMLSGRSIKVKKETEEKE